MKHNVRRYISVADYEAQKYQIGFLHGYQHAKCLARMDALNLEE